MKKILKTVRDLLALLGVIVLLLYFLEFKIPNVGVLGDILTTITTNIKAINSNISTVKHINTIDEHNVLEVIVEHKFDTTWVNKDVKYIDFNKIGINYKLNYWETETKSEFSETFTYRVKLGYKNINYYNRDGIFVADGGDTQVLSIEKIGDNVVNETGNRLSTTDMKNVEYNSLKYARDEALTDTNIQTAKSKFVEYTMRVIRGYNSDINRNDVVIKVK